MLRDGLVVYPPDALIRSRQLNLLIPHHRVTIQKWEKADTVPKRVHTSKQGRAWRLRNVVAWTEARHSTTTPPTPELHTARQRTPCRSSFVSQPRGLHLLAGSVEGASVRTGSTPNAGSVLPLTRRCLDRPARPLALPRKSLGVAVVSGEPRWNRTLPAAFSKLLTARDFWSQVLVCQRHPVRLLSS